MDAVKFIKEEIRMCAESRDCCDCPLFDTIYCSASPKKRSQEEAVEIVRRVEVWSTAHPHKTRQDAFLEQYPNASLDRRGVLTLCPKHLYCEFSCIDMNDTENHKRIKNCNTCCSEFWLQEVE